ncbi:hypothetical protein BV912_02710 [Neisseria dumasiana]|uniref:Type VI secretion protein n=1 Tax=Neisseria dumasiana TaxID=1931275 RepID=A0A1X3DKQ5_9NEIS|nr:hypothetical protein BV912_02710 [Neisseria dumasiana]
MEINRLKNKFYLSVFIILLSNSISSYAKSNEIIKNRQLLKNYGIAHCIAKFGEGEWLKKDLGNAKSLYFQAGSYHGDALKHIDRYFGKEMANSKEADSENNPLIFHKCLTIYNSPKYQKFINGLVK